MPDTFHTRLQIQNANAIMRGFTREAVRGRKDDVARFLIAGEDMIAKGIDAGIDKAALIDFAKGIHDAVSNAVGDMARTLDNDGCDPDDAAINMAELDALILELEGK